MFRRDQLLTQEHEARRQQKSPAQAPRSQASQVHVGPIAHKQGQEDIDIGLAGRQGIGIVKAVPDKVQYIDGKAQQKEDQKPYVHGLFLQADPGRGQIQGKEQQHSGAAVDVGPVVEPLLRLHSHKVPGQHVDDRKILGDGLGEAELIGSRIGQGRDLREKEHRRKASGQKAAGCKAQAPAQEGREALRLMQDIQGQEIDHQEQAGHNGDIVVGQDAESQGPGIKSPPLLLHQKLQSPYDQGEQNDAVQPHEVPVIGCHIAGKGIEDAEEGGAEVPGPEPVPQVPGHGKARKAQLSHHHHRHELDDIGLGTEDHKPVQGTCQIVGIEGRKVDSQSHVPAVKEGASGAELLLKLRKEGRILVIHIRPEEALFPEGEDAVTDQYRHKDQHQSEKGRPIGRHRGAEKASAPPLPVQIFHFHVFTVHSFPPF